MDKVDNFKIFYNKFLTHFKNYQKISESHISVKW